jgi:ferric-dicitrate binding protein FerR (iron transport regulator)
VNSRKEILQRLLDTDSWTSKEKEWLMHYLDGNDLTELEELARTAYNSDVTSMKDALDRRLSGRVLQNIHQHIRSKAEQPKRVKLFNIYRLSAAAALIILIGSVWFFKGSDIVNAVYPVRSIEVRTTASETKTVTLDDGSVVSLEENSVLTYPSRFNKATRDIQLKGEAFFEVAKDHTHPFIIHSPLFNTTVVGTSFEVRDDAADAKVVVSTGVVKVQSAQRKNVQPVTLLPTDGAILGKDDNVIQKKSLPDEARYYRQRKEGKFVYNGVPIAAVIKDVQQYYKTNIVIDDAMKHCLFYGSFNTKDNLDKVLKIIAITMNATVHENGRNEYGLSGGNCK